MKQTVHPRGGWQQEENDLLFAAVKEAAQDGRPLRDVFARVGEELHRKPNSIRNYYYAKVKDEPELAPTKATFRAFDQEELHLLLRDVLMAKGRGESVRACVIRRANGDRSAMLRYQNKYRSVLKNRPELLEEVAQELRREGLPCPADVSACRRYSPAEPGAALSRLPEGWEKEPGVSAMLEGLCTLLRRMEAQAAALKERAEAEAALGEAGMVAVDSGRSLSAVEQEAYPDAQASLVGCPDLADEKEAQLQAADHEGNSPESRLPDESMANVQEPEVLSAAQTEPLPASIMQVPYDKWLKTRQEADRLRVEVDLLKIALEEAEMGKAEPVQP